jgi:hypothetical protein
MNSAPVGSFPKFSSGFSENLVGGLLILPDRVVCSAVLLVFCALLLAGALGKGLLPFSCYFLNRVPASGTLKIFVAL